MKKLLRHGFSAFLGLLAIIGIFGCYSIAPKMALQEFRVVEMYFIDGETADKRGNTFNRDDHVFLYLEYAGMYYKDTEVSLYGSFSIMDIEGNILSTYTVNNFFKLEGTLRIVGLVHFVANLENGRYSIGVHMLEDRKSVV